ncbi:MAG TPA: hypothetical protein VN914_13930 [Polyangia bacterium]|nr:hypothetical protein [Polyangia bacterium]
MDALAGVSATRVYQLTLNGRPTAGATMTYSLWDPEGAVVRTASPAADGGDGTYSVALDGTDDLPVPGTYREAWLGSYSGLDLNATGPVLVGSDSGEAITRRALRWDVARQLQDLWLGTATDSSINIGLDPSITVPELVTVQNEWMGHEIYGYAGDGRGVTRRVTASGDFDGRIYVSSLGALDAGTAIEAHKRFTVDQYNAALRRAVREARGAWIDMEDRSLLQVNGQQEYRLPAGMLWLTTVETLDAADSDSWTPLFRTAGEWDASAGTLRLAVAGTTDVRMRLRGYRLPQSLDYDEQYADLPQSYLVDRAASLLAASAIRAPALDRSAAAQLAGLWTVQAVQQLDRSALQNAVWVGA